MNVTNKVIEEIRQVLSAELSFGGLSDPIAIYLHDDGEISSSPYAGVPPMAADGSDTIVWKLKAGDWDAAGDYAEALVSAGYIEGSPEFYAQMTEDMIETEITCFVENGGCNQSSGGATNSHRDDE